MSNFTDQIHPSFAKRLLAAFLVVAGLALGLVAMSGDANAIDRLGVSWHGEEYTDFSWKFEWRRTRADSNVFNAYWRHRTLGRFQCKITISLSGTAVTVSRPASCGGVACTYTGTYKPRDIHNARPAYASGTYVCGSFVGPWRARINF